MHHRGGLERVIGALGAHTRGCNSPELGVEKLNQPPGSLVIAFAKACHQAGYGIGLKRGWGCHCGYSVYPSEEKIQNHDTIRLPALPLRGEQAGETQTAWRTQRGESIVQQNMQTKAKTHELAMVGSVSNRNQFKYVPAGTGPAYWGPGDQITFLITGAETGGAFFMAEVSVPPGGGPSPHIHRREEETFFLQQGTLTIQVGGKTLRASPGDLIYLPRGIVHSFLNTGNVDAKFLMVATPAGLEEFFEEAFYPAVDGSAPPLATQALIARLLAAAPKHGLEPLPPA